MTVLYKTAHSLLNRRVKVRTKSGEMHIGKIVKVTKTHVYLQKTQSKIKGKASTKFFFDPFILPLVLFDLLAIILFL